MDLKLLYSTGFLIFATFISVGEALQTVEHTINDAKVGHSLRLQCNDSSLDQINWNNVQLRWYFVSADSPRTGINQVSADSGWFSLRPEGNTTDYTLLVSKIDRNREGTYECEITAVGLRYTVSYIVKITETTTTEHTPSDFGTTKRVVAAVIATTTVFCVLMSAFLIWLLWGPTEQEKHYYADKAANWGRGMTRMDVAHDFWTRYSFDNVAVDASNLSIRTGGSAGRPLEIKPSRNRSPGQRSPGHRSPGQRRRHNTPSVYSERGIEAYAPPPYVEMEYHTNPAFDNSDDKSSTV